MSEPDGALLITPVARQRVVRSLLLAVLVFALILVGLRLAFRNAPPSLPTLGGPRGGVVG